MTLPDGAREGYNVYVIILLGIEIEIKEVLR